MNNCTVEIVLPAMTTDATALNRMHAPSTLSVWLLNSESELDVKKLSFSTKPARVASLGRLIVSPGANMSTSGFACPPDAFPTIEVECTSSPCTVDVLHTGSAEGGVYSTVHDQWPPPIDAHPPRLVSSSGAKCILGDLRFDIHPHAPQALFFRCTPSMPLL